MIALLLSIFAVVKSIIWFILYITFIIIFVTIVINKRYHKIQVSRTLSSKIPISNPVNSLIHGSYNHSIRKMSV